MGSHTVAVGSQESAPQIQAISLTHLLWSRRTYTRTAMGNSHVEAVFCVGPFSGLRWGLACFFGEKTRPRAGMGASLLELVPTCFGVRTPRSAAKSIRNHFLWILVVTKKVFGTPSESSEGRRIPPYRSESAAHRRSRLRHLGDCRHNELKFRHLKKKSSQHDRSLSQNLTAKLPLWLEVNIFSTYE